MPVYRRLTSQMAFEVDDEGVEFYVDGQPAVSAPSHIDTTSPYEVFVDATILSLGPHDFKAVAFNNDVPALFADASVSVNVADTTLPDIAITMLNGIVIPPPGDPPLDPPPDVSDLVTISADAWRVMDMASRTTDSMEKVRNNMVFLRK